MFSNISLSHTVGEINAFYAEFKDGRQKWRENNFWQEAEDDSVDTLWGKKVEIFVTSKISFACVQLTKDT